MQNMMKLFDYIFYRIYRFYVGRGNDIADTFASNLVSLLQFFLLLDILAIIRMVNDFPIPHRVFIIPLIILLIAINWYRYQRDNSVIEELDGQWKYEETGKRKRNGWLIVLGLIGSFLFPVLYGILKHNLGVI